MELQESGLTGSAIDSVCAYRAKTDVSRREPPGEVAEGLQLRSAPVFGDAAFLEKVRNWLSGRPIRGESEKPRVRQLRGWVTFDDVRTAVEKVHAAPWKDFVDRRGDWGRDVALVVAHRHTGMTYTELARVVGMNPRTVASAIRLMRFRLDDKRSLAATMSRLVENEIQS